MTFLMTIVTTSGVKNILENSGIALADFAFMAAF
jgi:hypothetical protein